jgi:hypothetical protein
MRRRVMLLCPGATNIDNIDTLIVLFNIIDGFDNLQVKSLETKFFGESASAVARTQAAWHPPVFCKLQRDCRRLLR